MSIEIRVRYYANSAGEGGKGVNKEELLTLRASAIRIYHKRKGEVREKFCGPLYRFHPKVSRLEIPDEVCEEIHAKIGNKVKGKSSDYGLYSTSKKTWLLSDKFIGKTKVASGSDLCYKAKKRLLRIRFLDGTTKIINIDETKCVKQLIRDICEQLNIENPDELSLVVAGDYAVSQHHPAMSDLMQKPSPKTLSKLGLRSRSENWGFIRPPRSPVSPGQSPGPRRKTLTPTLASNSADSLLPNGIVRPSPPMSPGQRRKTYDNSLKQPTNNKRKGSTGLGSWRKAVSPLKKQLSKRHQIRIDTPWLDPCKTLAAQEVTEDDELILMYRFYYHMELKSDSVNTDMLFKQARATYLAGELLCSVKDMIQFTAVLCQIYQGDMDDKFSLEVLLKNQKQVAPPKWKIKDYYKSITADYAALKGMTVSDGKCCFIKLWSSLELFGFEFLSCSEAKSNQKGLIGISKDKILFLSDQKANKTNTWEFNDLIDCKQDIAEETVTLCFRQDFNLLLHLPEYSGVLNDCVEGHRDLQSMLPQSFWQTESFHFGHDQSPHGTVTQTYNFASQFAKDRERCALSNFTYDDIFRANRTFNPLFSDEEVENMECPWENPLFENTDQLMDERFSFLDLKEYSDVIIADKSQEELLNGLHVSADFDDPGADADSCGELLERIQPTKTDVKTAQRMMS